ncbi:MAG: TlpA family protein disulfide reductase [Planctomycetaceae bacterium]|nr:TlpA family protein disulfide reductase [Planctomycetaceae bacterium]
MLTRVVCCALILVLSPVPLWAQTRLEPGAVLVYQGTVQKRDRDDSPAPTKQFELTLLVREVTASGSQFDWLVDEQGAGAWPWIERFGRLSLNADRKPVGAAGPAVLMDHALGKSVVPIHAPLLAGGPALVAGATWSEGDMNYTVDAKRKFGEQETWRIEGANNYGPRRTVWIDVESPLVIAAEDRVFMGQGTEYQLQMRLASRNQLSNDERTATEAGFAALLDLREQLKRPARTQSPDWRPEQRELLKQAIPGLAKQITTGPLVRLLRVASSDLDSQSSRADALAELKQRNLGKPMVNVTVPTLSGDALDASQLKDKVTVLHFWDYRDAPLKEPYGQVGYVEFLYARHKAAGVQVYGVAVDGRFKEEDQRRGAITGVRKLKSFMNLTYPLLLDGGEWISKLGDPRTVGAELPLFVVVDQAGKIAHFHVGTYDVDQQDGLKELDAAVKKLLK